jgi:hypothetical protein
MLQVPLIKAFSLGSLYTKDGTVSGTGNIFLLRIITATNTKMETPITKRKTNLSLITFFLF